MAVLSTQALWEALETSDRHERLVVTPLLEPDRQVDKAAIDLRLGTEFISIELTQLEAILVDLEGILKDEETKRKENLAQVKREIDRVSRKHYAEFGAKFLVHPDQFILGSSLEYLGIPSNLMAHIVGRSSWGRLGLVIETAGVVAPGFKGVVTFELTNVGTVPIALYPGVRIAQLVVHKVVGIEQHLYAEHPEAKYRQPTGPEFSKVYKDPDWDLLARYVRASR